MVQSTLSALPANQELNSTLAAIAGKNSMASANSDRRNEAPLSRRPSRELWARSSELAQMAKTARTDETRIALETLSSQFAMLAARRELDEIIQSDE